LKAVMAAAAEEGGEAGGGRAGRLAAATSMRCRGLRRAAQPRQSRETTDPAT
jgi:hypothetical protein